MKASRSVHVMAANRQHSFPPIWLKMILVNFPSAVRRAALARTPVATLAVCFVCLAPVAGLAVDATRFLRVLAFVAFFFVFMAASPLGLGRYHTRVERES